MKKFFKVKIVIAILSLCVLAVSIGLFAVSPQEASVKCSKYCGDRYEQGSALYFACYDGCMFGALN